MLFTKLALVRQLGYKKSVPNCVKKKKRRSLVADARSQVDGRTDVVYTQGSLFRKEGAITEKKLDCSSFVLGVFNGA